jgi:hypothetical protein
MNGSLRICAMESTVLVSRVGERIWRINMELEFSNELS